MPIYFVLTIMSRFFFIFQRRKRYMYCWALLNIRYRVQDLTNGPPNIHLFNNENNAYLIILFAICIKNTMSPNPWEHLIIPFPQEAFVFNSVWKTIQYCDLNFSNYLWISNLSVWYSNSNPAGWLAMRVRCTRSFRLELPARNMPSSRQNRSLWRLIFLYIMLLLYECEQLNGMNLYRNSKKRLGGKYFNLWIMF